MCFSLLALLLTVKNIDSVNVTNDVLLNMTTECNWVNKRVQYSLCVEESEA